jgi:hypothetical protein
LNFVNVASATNNYDIYENDIVNQTRNTLISIISGMSQTNFGLDTMSKAKTQIRKYKELYIDKYNSKLYIDSGGYSVIVGDIHPNDGIKMIECYHDYAKTELDIYNRIFSLDIPIFLKYPNFCTYNHIYYLNYESLKNSKELLINNEEFQKKFQFVWHFKIKEQYLIWNDIYNKLELNKYVQNYAIGGLVGLRGIVNIKFAPFISLCFKILFNYIERQDFKNSLNIHILGIYIKTDRFMIELLEQLFNKYLEEYNATCNITYDSINYMRTAQLKSKNMEIYLFK